MKLDMDLAREILLAIEADPEADGEGIVRVEIPDRSRREVSYHVKQLAGAGLVEARNDSDSEGIAWNARALTWEGHQFLDEARDKGLWEKAKVLAGDKGAPLTLEVMKAVLGHLAKQAIAGIFGA